MSEQYERRQVRLASELQRLIAEFLTREAGPQSLVTVTACELARDSKRATIRLGVWPVEAGNTALDFTRRHERELQHYVKEHSRISQIPALKFTLESK